MLRPVAQQMAVAHQNQLHGVKLEKMTLQEISSLRTRIGLLQPLPGYPTKMRS